MHHDVSEVSRALSALHKAVPQEHGHRSLVVVVPLAEGRREVVEAFLEEGPPFDPAVIGLERHQAFLTDREAVFVFETEEGVHAFERILADPEFWSMVGPWEHNIVDEPRLGTSVFEWPAARHGAR